MNLITRTLIAAILLGCGVALRAQTTPASGSAEVNGTKLYYEAAGSGHALVLLHGGAVDSRAWDDQFAEFSRHFRVVRYDLRGSGKSASPDKPFSNTEDLFGLLKFLKVD